MRGLGPIAAVACPVALVAGGCGGGGTTADHANVLIGRPQTGVLRLAPGRSANSFTITALSPPRYVWDARVTAPANADVEVDIQTWYGVELQVLDSTKNKQTCRVTHARSVCLARFPLLEAQRPGRWTVIAAKHSGPTAIVRIAITFINP